MAANSTTERTIKTKIDGDAAGLRRAAREAEREIKRVADLEAKESKRVAAAQAAAEKERSAFLGQTAKGADALSSALAKGVTGILKVGAAAGSAQGLAGAAGALVTLSGAGLALPGVLLAAGAGMATFKLATAGFSDALAADDLESWLAATKNMAPAAVDTAVAVRDQKEAFGDLRKQVQGNFFDGFDGDVRDLAGTYLPVMKDGLGGIATEMNAMGRSAAHALLEPSSVEATNKVLSGTKDLFHELEPAIGNVLEGLLGLGGEGAEGLGGMGKAITGATADFKDFVAEGVKSGKINEIIDDGVDAAKDLGKVLGNVAQIGEKVFSGLSLGGSDFLGGMIETTQAVEDFLVSVEGQSALKELGETLGVVADVARNVLSAALHEVGPIITELAPAAREVAQAVGDSLVSALQTVGPLLTDVAGFLSDNKEVIGDLVPVVLGLAAAYKGMSIVNDVKGWVGGIPAVFGNAGKSADDLGGKLGDKGGGGLTGKLSALQGIGAAGFTIGSMLTIDAATNQGLSDALNTLSGFPTALDRAKEGVGSGFWDTLFDSPPATPGDENDIRNLKSTIYNHWLESERLTKGLQISPITFSANTQPARYSVDQLLDEVNGTAGTVNINGNDNPAGFALRRILDEIAAGHETVTIDGEPIPAQTALARVLEQIDVGSGTVNINGNDVPAGQALGAMLNQINGSSGTLGVNANTAAAEAAINNTARDRTATIYVNQVGSVNGSAVLHDRAIGGPVYGPGSGTSDTAGLFRLSNGEHILTAAEVRAAGGHDAIFRLRRALLSGRIPGFATGGPISTPSYLSASTSLPRQRTASTSYTAGDTHVSVFLDGQAIEARVEKKIDDKNRSARTAVRAGSGRGW